jgi:hypothetical protein
LNELKRKLSADAAPSFHIEIDLTKTEWMEPTSLMMLACLLHTHNKVIQRVDIFLGDLAIRTRHNFLSFLSRQNFLACLFLDEKTFVTCVSAGVVSNYNDLDELNDILQDLNTGNAFRNQTCIKSAVFSVEEYQASEQKIYELTEQFILESRSMSSGDHFVLNDYSKDRLFQRLRKFLFEAVQNCVDHAYGPGKPGFFSVFARVREGIPREFPFQQGWHDLHVEEKKKALAIKFREVNINAGWLEIFVVDVGFGLSRTAREWTDSEVSTVEKTKLARYLVGNTPLKNLGELLFRYPFSRNAKDRGPRTNVTGFQEIGRTLKDGGGYLRISTGLEAVGGTFPWTYPNNGAYFPERVTEPLSEVDPTGTALMLTLQPLGASQTTASEAFSRLTRPRREQIYKKLAGNQPFASPEIRCAFDKRFGGNFRPSQEEIDEVGQAIRSGNAVTIYVRLGKGATKRDVGHWFSDVVNNIESARLSKPILNFLFVDLYPFHAELLADFMQSVRIDLYVNSVSVVSITSHAVCFEKKDNHHLRLSKTLTMSFLASNQAPVSLLSVLFVLREMDSRAFWRLGTQVPITEAFIPANVTWTSSLLKPKPTEFFGYLDFSHALMDEIRARVCRRALLRFAALSYPNDIDSTDELTNRLVEELKVKNVEVFDVDGPSLLVSSVIVTGSTLKRFSRMSTYKNAWQFCFFNRVAKGEEVSTYALLNWNPPDMEPLDETYSRVRGTPFVSVDGDYAIKLSRLFLDDHAIQSHYDRDTQKTYADLDQYQSLQVGHWIAGRRHEFFSFRSERTIEQCVLFNSEPWRWFKSEIEKCLGDKNTSWIVLYPAHHATSLLASGLLADSNAKSLLSGRMFPINFLRERHVEPYFISPVTEDKITRAIGAQKKPVGVLIFDDAVISSRTMRAIAQIADHCSKKATGKSAQIKTVALLDRSGMPAYSGVMDRFKAKHRRFWRWDVPGINDGNHCPICMGLEAADAFTWVGMGSRRAARVTESWREAWSPVNIAERATAGHAVPISAAIFPYSMKFGVLKDGDRWIPNHIALRSAESLASSLIELTRLTHRADIALRKSEEFSKTDKDLASFILSSVYLHMMGSLRYWERINYLRQLVDNYWEQLRCNEITKLVGILLLSLDAQSCVDLYDLHLEKALSSRPLLNEDVAVALGMIISKADIQPVHAPRGTQAAKNASYLGRMFNGIDPFRDLFDLIGESGKTHHYSPFSQEIKNFIDKENGRSPTVYWDGANVILGLVQNLKDILERIDECAFEPLGNVNVTKDVQALERMCEDLRKAISGRSWHQCLALCKSVHRMVYNNDAVTTALCHDYRDAFFKVASRSEFIDGFLDACVYELTTNWSDYRSNKAEKVSQAWIAENGDATPAVFCGLGGDRWSEQFLVLFDQGVKGAIVEVLQNVIHSPLKIACPWTQKGPVPAWPAHAWWRAQVRGGENKLLRISIVTGSNGADELYVNEAKNSFQALRACGGKVHTPVVSDGLVRVDIDVPTISKEG